MLIFVAIVFALHVALRKESVDRNITIRQISPSCTGVALRKESVDRNAENPMIRVDEITSLSARRAWIEIPVLPSTPMAALVALRKESVDRNMLCLLSRLVVGVALRKESVDRNGRCHCWGLNEKWSLSARRAWIEITSCWRVSGRALRRSPQGERG